jgi:hypothetical protein
VNETPRRRATGYLLRIFFMRRKRRGIDPAYRTGNAVNLRKGNLKRVEIVMFRTIRV